MYTPMRKFLFPLAALAAVAAPVLADDFTVAVIPKTGAPEFWKAIHAGAIKAQRELEPGGTHVTILWTAPAKENDREAQTKEIEAAVARRVSGIVLAPVDSKSMVAPVETAVDAEIPVVIIDSGLESNVITSYVTSNNYESGKRAAICMGELLGNKGNVIVLRYMEHCAATEARELGFLEGLKYHYPEIKVLSSDQHSGIVREAAGLVCQNLVKRFGEELQGVFTPAATTTLAMKQALMDAGLAEKVKHIGFDATPEEVSALRDGKLHSLFVQDPFQVGYLGMKALMQQLMGKGRVEKKIEAPTVMITPENIEDPKVKDVLNPPLSQYLE